MKILYAVLLFLPVKNCFAQTQPLSPPNIFIITTDGFRWQELFTGADSAILFNPAYVKDTNTLQYQYWATGPEERRKKLMPFLWNYIAQKGQVWGNRNYENNVSVANPYRLSYPGYNELLTGYADRSVITNKARKNHNSNLLGYLNTLPAYKDKIALFGSWKLFSHIVNGTKNKIPLNCGYDAAVDDSLTITELAVNYLQENSEDNSQPTRNDLLTYTLATSYIKKKHPRIVYIGFGETDEFAHQQRYDDYLNQANLFDKLLAGLWNLIQQDEFYKNNTILFITTDHGRGRNPDNWPLHGPFINGSGETWMVQIGPKIEALGEVKIKADHTAEQFAQTIASYLGQIFIAEHPVAEPAYTLLPRKNN